MQERITRLALAVPVGKRWRLIAAVGIAILVLILALRGIQLWAMPMVATPNTPVLCLAAIQGKGNEPVVVYQRGTETREEAMRRQHLDTLIRDGFEVLDETCFESWQAAADELTNYEVLLPENAKEKDFMIAVTRWQQSNAE